MVVAGRGGAESGATTDLPLASAACRGLAAALALLCLIAPARSAERERLAIRMGVEADYGPFVYADPDGQVRGLSVDLARLLAEHADLQLTTMPPRPLQQLLEGVKKGEIDMVTSLRPTPERSAFLRFSKPYVSVPAAVVLRHGDARGHLQGPALWAALQGEAVAVGAGYAVESFARAAWPGVRWQGVPDDLQGLRQLEQGRVAATVVDVASLRFIARRHALKETVVADMVGFEYTLSFAVRRDRPDLLERIDDALNQIPAGARAAVVERWMRPLELPAPVRGRWPVREWIGGLLLLGLMLAAWGWHRSRHGSKD